MEQMEIILLVAGGLIFILSFFIRDGKDGSGGAKGPSEDEINRLVTQELSSMRGRMDEMAMESLGNVMESAKRSLEKLSNEKIMAVNEYSDTVLAEIHKNHEEAMFLYDMLNNKHASLKNALSDINRTIKEAEEASASLQSLMPAAAVPEENGFIAFSEGRRDGAGGAAFGMPETIRLTPEQEGLGGDLKADAFLQESDADESQDGQENNNAKILELYRQGKSVTNIARELNLGVGEVRLVVELFKG